MSILNLVFVILIGYIIYRLYYHGEHFEVVEYNSFEVPLSNQLSLYDQETLELKNIFNTYNSKILPDYKNTFQILF